MSDKTVVSTENR